MSRPSEKLVRKILTAWGMIILTAGLCQLSRTHPQYVDSQPRPGSIVEAMPSAITVTFSESLSTDSRLRVHPSILFSSTGERSHGMGPLNIVTGLDASDPRGRTMRAVVGSGLAHGLYRVQWTAIPARSRTQRSGSFEFIVGSVPPEVVRQMSSELRERDLGWRKRRSAIVGGVALIALALVFPWLPRKG